MNGWSSHLGEDRWDDEPAWIYEITWEWEPLPGQRYPGDQGRRRAVHTPIYEASRGTDAHGAGRATVGPSPDPGPGGAPGPQIPAQARPHDRPPPDRPPDRPPAPPRAEPSWNRPVPLPERLLDERMADDPAHRHPRSTGGYGPPRGPVNGYRPPAPRSGPDDGYRPPAPRSGPDDLYRPPPARPGPGPDDGYRPPPGRPGEGYRPATGPSGTPYGRPRPDDTDPRHLDHAPAPRPGGPPPRGPQGRTPPGAARPGSPAPESGRYGVPEATVRPRPTAPGQHASPPVVPGAPRPAAPPGRPVSAGYPPPYAHQPEPPGMSRPGPVNGQRAPEAWHGRPGPSTQGPGSTPGRGTQGPGSAPPARPAPYRTPPQPPGAPQPRSGAPSFRPAPPAQQGAPPPFYAPDDEPHRDRHAAGPYRPSSPAPHREPATPHREPPAPHRDRGPLGEPTTWREHIGPPDRRGEPEAPEAPWSSRDVHATYLDEDPAPRNRRPVGPDDTAAGQPWQSRLAAQDDLEATLDPRTQSAAPTAPLPRSAPPSFDRPASASPSFDRPASAPPAGAEDRRAPDDTAASETPVSGSPSPVSGLGWSDRPLSPAGERHAGERHAGERQVEEHDDGPAGAVADVPEPAPAYEPEPTDDPATGIDPRSAGEPARAETDDDAGEADGSHGLGWLLSQNGLGATGPEPGADPAEDIPHPTSGAAYADAPASGGAPVRQNWFAPVHDEGAEDNDAGATDAGATDPGTTDPGTTDPGTTDPGTTDPGTTDAGATEEADASAAANETDADARTDPAAGTGPAAGAGPVGEGDAVAAAPPDREAGLDREPDETPVHAPGAEFVPDAGAATPVPQADRLPDAKLAAVDEPDASPENTADREPPGDAPVESPPDEPAPVPFRAARPAGAAEPTSSPGRESSNRLVDPEQLLATYDWEFSTETLREQADDPDRLAAVRDRLTDKVEFAERDAVRARLLSLRAVVSRVLGDLDFALEDARTALNHAEATGELRRTAIVQARLAHVLQWRGDYAEADRLYEEANSVELPGRLRAEICELAGRSAYEQGRYLEAMNQFERALDLRPEADPETVTRIETALDSVVERTRDKGWGPYPRRREEILQLPPQPEPVPEGRYAEVQPFAERRAWVRRPGAPRWELIDAEGTLLIDTSAGYVRVQPFADGVSWVSRDPVGGWFAIDARNRLVVPGGFDDVRPFRRGVAAVQRGGWGAVDRYGRMVVPPKYHGFATALAGGRSIDGFTDEGLAVVDAGDRFGVLDRTGQMLIAPVHAAVLIHPVAYLIADREGRWGALDRAGEPLIDTTHRDPATVTEEIDRLMVDTRPVL
ncbi:WG repeat-containing protein [Mangrovihabitans endophyticus]|uniref:WG containing repeat-containing protein n=1 Tax=Mangrovihabitans endophyticus TaxID=1751298 RepID=A0A8J3FN01_9ACTN|nr:WG repeat-containing protein [Mangrovihabitans endophyticus]GGK87770.1 hypothetical protein GCM10012284_22290 [Mangrovihabitans endophyticus]